MFTILPFEEDIFRGGTKTRHLGGGDKNPEPWCHFVGHPAVEDFLETCGAYENIPSYADLPTVTNVHQLEMGADALLDLSKFDQNDMLARGQIFQALSTSGCEPSSTAGVRRKLGIPTDALVICALLGR
ncbi:unnamed protein product [Phytophthora fragariaefolia]|uniref:Unnamed protein product n=1 Tax=Phytophthora fragariaefolia TaxID=1490495 RepID=A0A9W6U1M4_9STRA|nr:unnamed protein product [Phytophthora fragariaefolia]